VVEVERDAKGNEKRAWCLVCGQPLIRKVALWVHLGWTDHLGMPEWPSKWSAW